MSFFWRKCETIMVKNLLVRKHHWLLTLFEILCPLALFALLTYVRNNSSITGKGEEHPVTFNEHMSELSIIEEHSFLDHDHVNFAYAPTTNFTIEFMRRFNSTPLAFHLRNMSRLGKYSFIIFILLLFRTNFIN